MVLEIILLIVIIVIILASIRIVNQWETGVKFRLGRYKGTLQPGLNFVVPIFDIVHKIDMRILTIDIPRQQVISKDNVPMNINGVVYFKVVDAATAIIKVQDFQYAVSQYAQTALRDVVGSMTLDQVLGERERIGKDIEQIVEEASKNWGIEVTDIKLQDIDMPEDLKRLMSRQASSEREKRATIIKSEGDRMASENLAKAASVMAKSPGAMQLRTLQTLDGLGPTSSNTVVIAIPVEVLDLARNLDKVFAKKKR
ncbi:MAG: slipin family protein [Candidatus Diapherotrites archaeon]|nr:slipin family protein [Candidatus Diapherotrites archaeon]